jgi:hypothetical protein
MEMESQVSQTPSSTVIERVVDWIRQSSSKELSGSLIGTGIKLLFPRFSFAELGYESLGAFLLKEGQGLLVTKQPLAGGDPLFVEYSADPVGPNIETMTDIPKSPRHGPTLPNWRQALRAYASPRGQFRLFAKTGEDFWIGPANADGPTDFVEIRPMTVDEHREIAVDFANAIPLEDKRTALLEAAKLGEERWHLRYWELTKKLGCELDWKAFRFSRIESSLKNSLASMKVQPVVVPSINPRDQWRRISEAANRESSPPVSARSILGRSVELLSEEDSRRVWLPLGSVLDALASFRQ